MFEKFDFIFIAFQLWIQIAYARLCGVLRFYRLCTVAATCMLQEYLVCVKIFLRITSLSIICRLDCLQSSDIPYEDRLINNGKYMQIDDRPTEARLLIIVFPSCST